MYIFQSVSQIPGSQTVTNPCFRTTLHKMLTHRDLQWHFYGRGLQPLVKTVISVSKHEKCMRLPSFHECCSQRFENLSLTLVICGPHPLPYHLSLLLSQQSSPPELHNQNQHIYPAADKQSKSVTIKTNILSLQ